MRVLMHCVYFPPEVGGLESHVRYLGRALVDRGHQVYVVTSRSRPDLPDHETIDGVAVWRTWLPARNTVGWAAHAFGSMPRFGALARIADVLHAQDIASVLPCMVAKRVRGAPIVSTYHTSHFLQRADSPFWRPIFKRFLEAADHNLAASAEIAAVASAIAPAVQVEALTNGVETRVFQRVAPTLAPPSDGRRRIVVPRRLFSKNGVEFFVRALPRIAEEVEMEAVIIGDGPERERLQALAHDLGVGELVDFVGSKPHGEMPGLLSSADLAIFPSLMEATSVAALEAMACELPVAASRVGGLPEIVDEAVGGLFEPGDPESLARVVVELLRRDRLSELGREGRRRVIERWSNDRLAERHLEIYRALISGSMAA